MTRIAYVNGRYRPFAEATVHVEDRGYQFADGVYEVIAFRHGALIDEIAHLDRLDRSLAEVAIAPPMTRRSLQTAMRELLRCNRLADGMLYMQVTRGVARRDHAFPADVRPSLVMTVRRLRRPSSAQLASGIAVITLPDLRWGRCDIKTIGLLPNVLAKQAARSAGAFEAWLVDRHGQVTEGSSTNAWIVTGDGTIVTRDASSAILNGVTRLGVVAGAEQAGLRVVQRPFTVAEALQAREAFLTSTTSFVLPVVSIDGHPIGTGVPGKVTTLLRASDDSAAPERP